MNCDTEFIDGNVAAHLETGLRVLVQASRFARDLRRDAWDFAVEIGSLRRAGLDNNDFRWLLWKGIIEHGRETTTPNDDVRQFHRGDGRLVFGNWTCFVLTEKGMLVAEHIRRTILAPSLAGDNRCDAACPSSETRKSSDEKLKPEWDCDRQELRVGEILVKQFKLPSPNQQKILMAFEEDDWPPRIDDPLPPCRDIDPKRRLNDAIKRLNRHQKTFLVHFMGDGTGLGARWELSDG